MIGVVIIHGFFPNKTGHQLANNSRRTSVSMRIYLPEISWHDREPIYSCSFNPADPSKFATCGVGRQIRLWRINSVLVDTQPTVDFLSEMSWHSRTVNVVRFSNTDGLILASGGDDAVICLSKLAPTNTISNRKEEYSEIWQLHKTLRGHLEDVLDLVWGADNLLLFSSSVDNAVIIWDVEKGVKQSIVNENLGFVQSVAIDPFYCYLCTLTADQTMRVYNFNTLKKIFKVYKLSGSYLLDAAPKMNITSMKLFMGKEYGTFLRKLMFTIDGQFLIATGAQMLDSKGTFHTMAAVVFHRDNLNRPIAFLSTNQESTIGVAVYPYKLVKRVQIKSEHDNGGFASKFNLKYRLIVAVLTEQSILLYDSEQERPFGRICDIHYASLTDIAWSSDGRYLSVTSIDGYVTFVMINLDEFGEIYKEDEMIAEDKILDTNKDPKQFEFTKFGKHAVLGHQALRSQQTSYQNLQTEEDISLSLSHQMEESMEISNR
ncbi:hypothetical protein GJ496_004799 [Pomphorhynchus laevis]|nr:hypothetical protein GJ496_004799 [Pomphorhynchus laevis]